MNPIYSTTLLPQGGKSSYLQIIRFSAVGKVMIVLHMIMLMCMSAVLAQTPASIIDEGLRRQEERMRDQQQQVMPKVNVLKPQAESKVSTTLPTETPCFVIRQVHIKGAQAEGFGWLSVAVRPYVGQCAGVDGLTKIVSTLDEKLIDRGYVTSRVTLPGQNLSEGTLTLQLHVGRIAGIEMLAADQEHTPDKRWGTWRNAFPVQEGDVLNIRNLEQGIEQMKRLPSQSVTTTLAPGAEPDTSKLSISRQTGPWQDRVRGGITVDNSGSRTLGRTQLFGALSLDNVLGLNDIVALTANTNTENLSANHRTQGYAFSYSIPWGYNTFTYSRSSSRYAQQVRGTTMVFLSSGRSQSDDIKWHRTVWRSSASKLGVYAGLSTRRAQSYIDDTELLVNRRRTANAEVGLTYKYLFDQASLDVDLGYRRGIGWRGAEEDYPSASHGGLTLRPTITTLSAVYDQRMNLTGHPLRYTLSLRSQFTRDLTLSVDQFAIGSRYLVRGFDGDSVLLADSGFSVRNDLAVGLSSINSINTSVYGGIDFGRVWGHSAGVLAGNALAGAALGVRGQARSWQFDLSLGTPLYKPEGFRTRRWNPFFSLTYAY